MCESNSSPSHYLVRESPLDLKGASRAMSSLRCAYGHSRGLVTLEPSTQSPSITIIKFRRQDQMSGVGSLYLTSPLKFDRVEPPR